MQRLVTRTSERSTHHGARHDVQGIAFRALTGRTLVPVVVLGGRPSYPATQSLELVPSIEAPMEVKGYRFDTSMRNEHIVLTHDHMEASGTSWGSFAVSCEPLVSGVHTFRFKVRCGAWVWVDAVRLSRHRDSCCCPLPLRPQPQIVNKAPSGGICVGCVTASFDIATKNVAAAPGSWGYSSSGKKVRSQQSPRRHPHEQCPTDLLSRMTSRRTMARARSARTARHTRLGT